MQTTELLPPVRPLSIVEVKFVTSQEDVYYAVLLNLQAHNMDISIAENIIEHRAFCHQLQQGILLCSFGQWETIFDRHNPVAR
jgi:hypothetical protein